ncbi:hypothetical protein GLOTRDRAFT_134518 [Gloeophyllum trabeum ATCC 11539]|uniref:Uncharacterized protein n=1 Tax=Gloeophyllum trabeum (strain ATCC 11539 / FP-39264 / Madison 617) TaxID=670483 RepID=S7PQX2_GLOTA|nr:uncharacterized protein GLOTRDRAFT_134518 [Gloeophyllum trabeum ATCC 11539]EPQ49868.1 hypothetical protein GLOTRDRAFT_134518 [Gloeophyllum trabeum ATCC 11539]
MPPGIFHAFEYHRADGIRWILGLRMELHPSSMLIVGDDDDRPKAGGDDTPGADAGVVT